MALVTSILILLFLSLAGGALISSTRVDVQIASNYGTGVRSLYLAEAGIEAGREALRTSGAEVTTLLTTAAGADGNLASGRDLTGLLAGDDAPLLPADSGARSAGLVMSDTAGRAAGSYHVWLRNDVVDDRTATADTNDIVTLVSVARIGDATRTVEAVVRKATLPDLPAALTLNGPVNPFLPATSSIFEINGLDQSGNGNNLHAIGVISGADETLVSDAIPSNRANNYTGLGGETPNVEDISGDLGSEYTTVSGLEAVVEGLSYAATSHYDPGLGNTTALPSVGSAASPEIVVVDGNCDFGPGDGYGILVVRGDLVLHGNFSWTGIILVIGQGTVEWNGGGHGEISGGILLARTRDEPTVANPLGPLRATRGDVSIDFNGGGGNGISFNSDSTANAQSGFPFIPISFNEY
jgi:hypothetical protein